MIAAARTISHFLTSPGKVAHALDWKKYSGNVLNLIISKEKIEMAVASHPEFQEKVRLLNPVPIRQVVATTTNNNTSNSQYRRRILDSSVPETLAAVMEQYNVCGIIVGWPVEREGWCGASCGRVLYTLDQLVQASSEHGRVITMNRPICLYDMDHHIPDEDEWGRSAVYSEISYDSVHICSEEQSYHNFCATHAYAVTSLWNDFCTTQWPQLSSQLRSGYAPSNTAIYAPQYGEDVDDWEYGHDISNSKPNEFQNGYEESSSSSRNYRPAA